MNNNITPQGEERKIKFMSSATIDGTPVAYIIVLAAVVTVMAFIPMSIVLGSGKSFPMSQGIYPLVGWLLGPVAGAVASGTGALIGILLAPYTATLPVATLIGAVAGSFVGGSIHYLSGKRKWWWLPISIIFIIAYGLYAGRAVITNGVNIGSVLLGSVIDWTGLLLFILPTRVLCAKWLKSNNPVFLAIGIFMGTWMVAGLSHLSAAVIIYYVFNWPEAVWLGMAPMAPVEHLTRAVVGTVIGTGVISGLRAIRFTKSRESAY